MNIEKRELLAQFAFSGIIRELDLDLNVDPENEIDENSIFELEFRPLDRNGFEKSSRRKILDLKKSNLVKLENSGSIDAALIDKFLLEHRGLNLTPTLFLDDAPEYAPKLIFRRIPIDYGAHKSTPMYGIGASVRGKNTTYLEESWERKDEPSRLFDSIRQVDPYFQLVPDEHENETKKYNFKLKNSLKGVFLVESIRLIDSVIGLHKTPFDFTGPYNLRRELGHIKEVNSENYLTTSLNWLSQIRDNLGGWAYSVYQIQKAELKNFQDSFKDQLEGMEQNLKLQDSRFWSHEKDDVDTQVEYLKKLLFSYKLLAELNAEASEKLFARLRDMACDFGSLMEQVIDK